MMQVPYCMQEQMGLYLAHRTLHDVALQIKYGEIQNYSVINLIRTKKN